MVIQQKHTIPVEAFEQFIHLPENSERKFEYIAGEAIEMPSNPFVSMIAGLILTALNVYLRDNLTGFVTGEAGRYIVSGEIYAPDVAFISKSKQPQLVRKGFNPNPPDLAIEAISDADSREEQTKLRIKLTNYLAAGVVVWIANPDERRLEIHRAGHPVQILGQHDVVNGGDILPGFQLPVKDIFPEDEG